MRSPSNEQPYLISIYVYYEMPSPPELYSIHTYTIIYIYTQLAILQNDFSGDIGILNY